MRQTRVVTLIVLILTVCCWADRVYLRNGRMLEGEVSVTGNQVVVKIEGGQIGLRESDIERIERALLPQDAFPGKLKESLADSRKCLELARWAWQNNLVKEYGIALRAALLADQNNAQVRKLLQEYRLYYARLEVNQGAADQLLADLGPGFKIYRTEHYRIGYNCSDEFVQTAGEKLERLYEQFMRFFSSRGFEPAVLTDRLEVVLFNTRVDYQNHVRRILPEMSNAAGFYYSGTNRSYFYDSIASDNQIIRDNIKQLQDARQHLNKMREQIQSQSGAENEYVFNDETGQRKLDQSGALTYLDERARKIELEYQRMRSFYYEQNAAITIHEGTHQLAWQCGIHSRYFRNPKWLVEGLAVYFEAPEEGQWRQPGMVHLRKLKSFVESDRQAGRIGLAQLIVRDELFNPSGNPLAEDAYATGWALFYYLAQKKHERLFDYIYELSMKMESPDYNYSNAERLADFERYFGSIDAFERSWRADMARLYQTISH